MRKDIKGNRIESVKLGIKGEGGVGKEWGRGKY